MLARFLPGAHPYDGGINVVYYTFTKKKNSGSGSRYTSNAFVTGSGLTYDASSVSTSRDFVEDLGNVVGMIWIFFDTNGIQKGPNRDGYDRFCIGINPQSGHIDTCNPYSNDSSIHTSSCYINGYLGLNCSYYALADINPANHATSYWKNLKL